MSMSTEDCLVQSGEIEEKRSSRFQLSMSIVNVEPETSQHSTFLRWREAQRCDPAERRSSPTFREK